MGRFTKYLFAKRLTQWVRLLLVLTLVLGVASSSAWAVNIKAETVVTSGLSLPGFGTAPVGESGFLYIAEQNNVAVKRLNLVTKQITTFLDLPNIAGAQFGLSSLAFHPDYASNGKFYLNLYDPADAMVKIVEYQRSASNPLVADPATKRDILQVHNPSGSHNGGWLGFNPFDGYLYIATGDGGAIEDVNLRGLPAQDLSDARGKILRIDVDEDDFPMDATLNYGVPDSNPFEIEGEKTNIFAYGLRHPFRNSFDRLTGDMYIGDVGSARYEEVNFIPANSGGGQNFGWRALEGPFDNPTFPDPAPANAIDPIHYYGHMGGGAAIMGGYVYRGSEIPGLQGHYITVDQVTDLFTSFKFDGSTLTELVDRTEQLAHPTAISYAAITSFGEDADGEIYFFDRTRGDVFKIVAGAIEGDFDEDGDVDGDDLVIWQAGYGINANGDADNDLDTDGRDFLVWQRNYTGALLSASTAVPEPGAGVLVTFGALAWCLIRKCPRRLP